MHALQCITRSFLLIYYGTRSDQNVKDRNCKLRNACMQAGEELTYDYRFNGEEKLPCNCGAASCRGFVNAPDEEVTVMVVQRSDLGR